MKRIGVVRSRIQMYRVCWASVLGRTAGRGRPLPRDVAEFVARDESLANPMRHFWIEECLADDLDLCERLTRRH